MTTRQMPVSHHEWRNQYFISRFSPSGSGASRWIQILFVFLLISGAQGIVAKAQTATPAADSRIVTQIDLAALTIRPSDLQALGVIGFGLANWSSLRDAETDAILQARGDEVEAARRLAIYRETGYRYRYVGSLLRPQIPLVRLPSGLLLADHRINSSVTEYATAEGAAASFALLEGGLDHIGGRDLSAARAFGDQSEITRSRGREVETGDRFHRVELSFRVDNLVAEIAIINYDGTAPDLVLLEQLGDLLFTRIEEERQTNSVSHISPRVLRVAPFDYWIERGRYRDFYVRIDELGEIMFGEIARGLQAGLDLASASIPNVPHESVRPDDTYLFWTPIGRGEPRSLPLYVSWIDRYPSPEQASVALAAVTNNLGPGYTDVRELAVITEPLGDGVRAFSYHYLGDPNLPVSGHLVIVRVDEFVIRVHADGPHGVQREGVVEMARRQVECLQTMDACVPVLESEAEAAILPIAPPTPDATPQARG